MEQNVILPTIGRRLWFWPQHKAGVGVLNASQPCDAGVVFVYDERTVNLDVTDHLGRHSAQLSVRLVQPGDPIPDGPHATWMDYQVKVATFLEPTLADAADTSNPALSLGIQIHEAVLEQKPFDAPKAATVIAGPLTNDDQRQESVELQSTGEGTGAADDAKALDSDT